MMKLTHLHLRTLLASGLALAIAIGFILAGQPVQAATNDLYAQDDPLDGQYCASTEGGAVSVDVMKNDHHATISGNGTTMGGESGLRIDGNYAYVAGYNFQVFDVSNSSNPTEVANLGINRESQLRDFHIKGDYVYVADSGNDRMWVIDISDPVNPRVVGDVYFATDGSDDNDPWGAESIDVKGDYALVLDNNPGQLISVDVSNPGSPNIVATTSATTIYGGKELEVSGDYAYVIDSETDQVNVYDVADPSTLSQVGSVGVTSAPETVDISGNYAYVGGEESGLSIVDVSSPVSPSVATSFDMQASSSDVTSIHSKASTTFVSLSGVDGSDNPDDAGQRDDIKVLDTTSPTNPQFMWKKELGDSPERIYAAGDYVYAVDSGDGALYVIDPDVGYTEINSYTQPSNGTVSLDDQGTSDQTDDELVYNPSATGTDSFTYNISGDPRESVQLSEPATVRFDVQTEACNQPDIGISADPQTVPQKDGFGTTTISWNFDGINYCETQDGSTEWRNIDADASSDCNPSAGRVGACSGSDRTDISGLDADTTFTLACDTANDGDNDIDTSTSTTVTVTDLTECPLVEGGNPGQFDKVVSLNDKELNAKWWTQSKAGLSLSPGTYDMSLYIFDDARGEFDRAAQNQEFEQVYARFANTESGYSITTRSSADIPDDTQLGKLTLEDTITLNQPTDVVQARHHAFNRTDANNGDNKAHSYLTGCIGVDDRQSDPSAEINARDKTIEYGGTADLAWKFTNVSSGTTTSNTGNTEWANTSIFPSDQTCLDVGSGQCTGSSTASISDLTRDTTFAVSFDGTFDGSVSDSVTIDVADKPVKLDVDLDTVNVGGSTTLAWSTTNMDTCAASSNPTDPDWTIGTNPNPSGGTQELTNIIQTTDYTLTCENTSQGTTLSDTATVSVSGFDLNISPQNIWGVQLAGSLTTQAKITVAETNFTDDIKLSASPADGTGIGASFQFLDDNGNPLSDNTLSPTDFDDGVWLQAQLGNNIAPGQTTLEISAEAENSTTSASDTIDMHIRSIGEQ